MARPAADDHQWVAGALVMALLVWLARHPMVAVLVALLLPAGLAWGLAVALRSRPETAPPPVTAVEGGIAASTLPEPTEFPPRSRVVAAHRGLHDVGRACEVALATRSRATVEQPVHVIEQFARDFPNGGFTMDGESGTTLALLVVLRYELQSCDTSLVADVEELLPQRFRDLS